MNKQIEEMAKIIDYQPIMPICLERDKCAECRYSKYDDRCKRMRIAEALYDAGHRKANDDEVVIGKAEYERLKKYRTDWFNDEKMHLQAELEETEFELASLRNIFKQTFKETATTILQEIVFLATEMENEDFMSIDAENAIARLSYQIQEYFKTQYGVEVK